MSNNLNTVEDRNYHEAVASVENTLARLRGCPPEEIEELQQDISQLNEMYQKVTSGRVAW